MQIWLIAVWGNLIRDLYPLKCDPAVGKLRVLRLAQGLEHELFVVGEGDSSNWIRHDLNVTSAEEFQVSHVNTCINKNTYTRIHTTKHTHTHTHRHTHTDTDTYTHQHKCMWMRSVALLIPILKQSYKPQHYRHSDTCYAACLYLRVCFTVCAVLVCVCVCVQME